MNRLPIVIVIIAGLILSSCSKKIPDFVHSIPDEAIGVMSLNPMQLHTKGKMNTLEKLKEKVKDEIWGQILEDPLSTGLMMDEYTYVFVKMEEGAPVIGVISGMKDMEKFESTLGKIDDEIDELITETDGYKYMNPDEEGIIAWNDDQMIVLTSPDNDEFELSYWTSSLDQMFNPVKEESITSLVDFNDFLGKMKDVNLWVSSNDLRDLIEKVTPADMEIDLPVELYNNYAQVYMDFDDGVLNINGETHLGEEVEKNIEEVLVMNPSLNEDMLKLAPAGNLLLAIATSMDLEKVQSLVKRFAPPELGEVGNKVEQATGVPAQEILNAFTGDFAIVVNGLEGEPMIPIELFIGIGVNGEAIQKQLMASVQNMVPVEEQGDFFVINVQGNEIYSGLIDNLWVITNAKGYKDAVENGKLDKSLVDSKFDEFAGGSMGMYVNLDLESYPSMVEGLLEQKPEQSKWIGIITDPFESLGVSASNYQSKMVLETNKPNENSLYTILKLTDTPD